MNLDPKVQGAGIDFDDLGESPAWWTAVMADARNTVICHPAVWDAVRGVAKAQGRLALTIATSERCPVDQVMTPLGEGPGFEFAVSVMRRGDMPRGSGQV